VPFRGLNPPDIKNPKRGIQNHKKNSDSSTLSDVEIFAEFITETTFEIQAKVTEISPEKSIWMVGSRSNENNYRQKTTFPAWPS